MYDQPMRTKVSLNDFSLRIASHKPTIVIVDFAMSGNDFFWSAGI